MPAGTSPLSQPDDLTGLDLSGMWQQAMGPRSEPWVPPSLDELAGQIPQCEITGLLGRGGMGAVYRARQTTLDREVAVKILPPEVDPDGGMAERFRREGRILARLSHPYIVAVYDSGTTADGHLYIVMELASGGDLAKWMRRERLPVDEAVRVLMQVGAAVAAAHEQSVLHRDLKPSNVLLMSDGTAKVADFGLAVPMLLPETERLTREDTTMGTAEYAAPEQFSAKKGGPPPDQRADIYSLGVLAYELFTGDLPRGVFELPSQKVSGLDPAVDAVVLQALQSDPRRRFATAGEFCAALTAAMDRRTQQEKREREARIQLRRRTRMAAAFGSLALAAAAAAVYGWRQQRAAEGHAADAVSQKTEAQQQRLHAEELIDYLVSDLQANLRQTGREALIKSLVVQLEHYFAAQPARTDTGFLRRKANGLRIIAAHHLSRGNAELGLRLTADVLSLRETVAAREPGDPAALIARNQSLVALEEGRIMSEHPERASFENALTASRTAAQKFPENISAGLQLVHTLLLAGQHSLTAGKVEIAAGLYRELEGVCRPFLQRNPGDGNFLDYARNARAGLVECRESQGDAAGALSDNEAVIAECLRMMDVWPDYDTLRISHLESLSRKARLLLALARPSEADTFSLQALHALKDLMSSDPSHRTKLDLHSQLLIQHSRIRMALHDEAGAAAALADAQIVCERVLTASPLAFSFYDRRAEVAMLLAPLRPPDKAAHAAFLRRYANDVLMNSEPPQGQMDYLVRLESILRESVSHITAADGPAAAATWRVDQLKLVRRLMNAAPPPGQAPATEPGPWAWLVSEMEKHRP